MIAYMEGIITDADETGVVLECGQIGYYILMSQRDLGMVASGQQIKIYTWLNVREDALVLFGFLTRDDRRMFRLLLNVSGIGPKGAIGILSALTADEIRYAVLSDDAKAISTAPGIGTKTARKLILELKDKFSLDDLSGGIPSPGMPAAASAAVSSAAGDAVAALTALGYSSQDALRAVKQVADADSLSTEQILKKALKFIF